MSKTLVLAALSAVLAFGSPAMAQTPAAAPAAVAMDPVKMELARKIFADAGGAEAMTNQMKAMFGAIGKLSSSVMPAGHEALGEAFMKDITDEELKLVPQLIDDSAEVYAQTFTEKELRDLLVWNNSETGRAVRAKTPAMTQALMQKMVPHMQALMPVLIKKTLDRACDEQKCTPEVRRTVAEAMDRALSAKGS